MKLAALSAIVVPAVVSAHGIREVHHARQQPAGSSISSVNTPLSTPSLTFTLASTNPSAIPLSSITANMPSSATFAPTTTFQPGTSPTFLPNAPPLPNALSLNPSSYPPLDKTPPIDSDEVQQWIKEVDGSGISIPNIPPTNPGGCPNNTAAASNTSICWWTCGGCVRDEDITQCKDPMTWGLTYDDGPALFTGKLLSYLDSVNLKATFFIVGSRAISYPALLQEEYMAQHQIAGHTWSHSSMTTLTNEQIIAELGWSKKIIKDVLGVTPLYWRPPYGDVDDRVRAIATAMGLQTSLWTRLSPAATFDTGDFDIAGGLTTSTQVLNNWQQIVANASTIGHGFIVLEHDLFEQTVEMAVDYILPDALAHQPPFKIEPIVSCLDKPLTLRDAYLETNDNASNALNTTTNGTNTSGSLGSNSSSASESSNNNGSVATIAIPLNSLSAIAFAIFSGAVAVLL